jgi:hypothetical protein
MARSAFSVTLAAAAALLGVLVSGGTAHADGEWEVTPKSQRVLDDGLAWLARNQGPEGNWGSDDLGLVSSGALAFLAAGHLPGRGTYGRNVERALDYVLDNAQPSGLLNIAADRRATYNHGLSTFVLGQAYGMTDDPRIGPVLDRALRFICQTQALDGGWDYEAVRKPHGHDLSLAVMQALALRSAVDSGLEVPPQVVELAIQSVREHYTPFGCPPTAGEAEQRKHPGQFTYTKGRRENASLAMAAAGVVCLQEFGQYDDWRIAKNMEVIHPGMLRAMRGQSRPPDAYTTYYVAQALYQVGGEDWRKSYPALRDYLVKTQNRGSPESQHFGSWQPDFRVGGDPGRLYMTSVACFVLAIPNRYLPILQEGRIEGLEGQYGGGTP